jgi:hypothetical protein
MSNELINRSKDLKRLRDEGYSLTLKSGCLLVDDVPYVNAHKQVNDGVLVIKLTLAGDVTAKPDTHVAYFRGEYPCNADGNPIEAFRNASNRHEIAEGVIVDHTFSAKPQPTGQYEDYYAQVITYAGILNGPAESIDKTATARRFRAVEPTLDDEDVFNYLDTATSRAAIGGVSKKFRGKRVAIIGAGGTASYILDLIAKTPLAEIHLYDGDTFLQHNAFRAPGAPTIDELREQPKKVDYLAAIYSKMRRYIFPHPVYVDASNVEEILQMDFVFLACDGGTHKKMIVKRLEDAGIAFVDVGMGVTLNGDSLGGLLRVTTSTSAKRYHVWDNDRIPFADGGHNEYDSNIQIADLNALNASLAVVKFKKYLGIYRDAFKEHNSLYAIDGNKIFNEDHHEADQCDQA